MTDKKHKKSIVDVLKRMSKKDYGYYYDDTPKDFLERAFEMERNYILNCSDFKKDFSPEARNRRFEHYLKIAKKR